LTRDQVNRLFLSFWIVDSVTTHFNQNIDIPAFFILTGSGAEDANASTITEQAIRRSPDDFNFPCRQSVFYHKSTPLLPYFSLSST